MLKNLVDGLSEAWVRVGQYWKVPCKSSITEARQPVGPQVISRLFHQVVRHASFPGGRATPETRSSSHTKNSRSNSWGLRVMAVDGTVFDVPDSPANARVFGYPASRPGTTAHDPKVRLVLLIEAQRAIAVAYCRKPSLIAPCENCNGWVPRS